MTLDVDSKKQFSQNALVKSYNFPHSKLGRSLGLLVDGDASNSISVQVP